MTTKRIKDLSVEATSSTLDDNDYGAVDSTANGTRKFKLSALVTWIFGKIKSLPTTKYKGFMALDDADGTGKMDVSTIFNNFAGKFEDNVTEAKAGKLYMHNGSLYEAKEDYTGVWDASKFRIASFADVLRAVIGNIKLSYNPEYALAFTDGDGKFLFGVKETGEFTWAEGVPSVIRTYTETFFVEKEIGKSLIDGTFAGSVKSVSNPEYVIAFTDGDGEFLFGVKETGEFVYGKSEQIKEDILSEINKVKSSNILVHKIYNSSSISDELSIDNAVGEYIWISVLVDDYYATNYTYSIEIIDGSNAGVLYSGLYANRDIMMLNIGKGCTKIRFIFSNEAAVKVAVNAWNYYDRVSATLKIDVAGGDPMAHFICDGVNDEEEFSEAVAAICFSGVVEVNKGTYYFDDLPERFDGKYGAVLIGTAVTWYRKKLTIRGLAKGTDYVGTRIIVRDSAFDNVPAGVEASIFGSNEIKNAGVLKFYDLRVDLESNDHKVVIVNGQYLGGLVVNNCSFNGGENAWSETPPPQGSVGIRGVMGDCNGTEYEIKDTYCIALYEGFQLGGEHLVMTECGTRFCYYGYSFGNYDYGSWYGDNPVTDSHPLTLINCCDEGSRRLPLFAKCGVHSESGAKALQPVDLISFNLEVHTASLVGAEEVTPGSFCGRIDFVAYGASNSSKSTSPEATRGNRVDVRFWKNGSGSNFRTTNATHKQRGTTTERLGYWAQYMQQFYDVTLNKMLVCVDEENQTWVDFNGTSV